MVRSKSTKTYLGLLIAENFIKRNAALLHFRKLKTIIMKKVSSGTARTAAPLTNSAFNDRRYEGGDRFYGSNFSRFEIGNIIFIMKFSWFFLKKNCFLKIFPFINNFRTNRKISLLRKPMKLLNVP